MAAASDGNPEHYPFNLEKEFKVELTREALHALINEPVVVSVGMDKKDFKACIKEIDLLDLVLGRQKNVAIPEDPLPGPGVEGNWAEQVTLFGVSIEVVSTRTRL